LTQASSVENYANKFQNLCVVNLQMSAGDKIHCFIIELKPEIRLMVTVDPLNNAQAWEDFQRLVTHVVSIDANLQQMKSSFDILPNKINESKKSSIAKESSGGPIRTQKSTMKFSNGREIDYKKVGALKREGKCYSCEEKGHRANDCFKKNRKNNGEKREKMDF
jgi:NifB/MoaA-like Fe-S oxidoreductase